MKLYTYDPAPNPKRLQAFIDYKGIEIETQQIDLGSQEQLGDAYRAINPACTVPFLVTDEGVGFSDVIAMVVYLEDKYPEKPLLGTTAIERAQVMAWNLRLMTTLGMPIADVFRNSNPHFAGRAQPGPLDVEQLPELAERGQKRLDHTLPSIDAHLANSPWLAGELFSFADIELVVFLDFMGWIKRGIPDDCANLKAWEARARAELA